MSQQNVEKHHSVSQRIYFLIKTGESGLTVFRLLTKDNCWKWVQANARLVYKNGKPDYIIATQRPLLDEEGGEHLRKRSMHLPFTFATGEALLYQANHPIAGFIDVSQEKNSSKSKMSQTERLLRDGLDPGSLLGALMSQDQSVYVCQPALEPKTSFHSSLFRDQKDVSVSEPSRQSRSWDEPRNGVLEPGISEPSTSFDPLLATLDSLTLEGQGVVDEEDGGCSNSELFGALEGLGLSAEDLELLLLDERMIRVELDSEHVPTLDDLLTNDEILSYISNCIEGKAVSTEDRRQALPSTTTVTSTVSASENNPRSDTDVQMHFPHCKPILVGQAPIVQLSQQMQQHLNMQTGKLSHDWSQHNYHLTNGELLGHNPSLHNGHRTSQDILVSAGIHLQQINTQQMVFSNKASDMDDQVFQQQMHQQFQHQQQSMTQKQLSEHCHAQTRSTTFNGMCDVLSSSGSTDKSQWQDFGFTESLGSNTCPDNSQKLNENTSLDLCINYRMPEMTNVHGSVFFGKVEQQDGSEFTVPSLRQQQQQEMADPFAQVISSLSQCASPNTSLEQILGVGKPCHQLDHNDIVSSKISHDPSNSKIKKSCILNSFCPGSCVLSNRNGAVPPAVIVANSETLPRAHDPQSSSFYL
ncbi:hypothetical protein CRENBAI_000917 [Crenichthys baileyi]|uniref:Aryl hydrocarbon receptor n=1 Tax=Crenichthys baileyi TaxID=28760 RepID=A0AAV9RHC8_9TELE